MKRFSSDFIENLLFASDIVALIQEDTNLKGSGSRYMGLCPFPDHSEKTPSFSVSGEKQLYNCFGCQKSGNIFTYLKEQRGFSFREAVEYLAEKAHIPLPRDFVKDDAGFEEYKNLKNLNKKAAYFYHQSLLTLPKSSKAWAWLNKRGYSSETISGFQLGYAPKGNLFLKTLKEREIPAALKLGLLSRSGKDSSLYDTYRDRLIFPIFSTREEVIGFGARVLSNTLPKYINSKDSKIFSKGQMLYGLNQSGKFLRNSSSALIVEGYTDFLSLWQRGIKNVAATLGTSLTEGHGACLRRYVRSVILLFDGDEAGEKAAERSLLKLLSQGLEVKGILLPSHQDPDEFIRDQGKGALEKLIASSEDLFFRILRKALKESREKGRHSFYLVEKTAPFLKKIPNKELQSLYKNRILDVFGSDRGVMEKALSKALAGMGERKEGTTSKDKMSLAERPSLKKILSAAAPAERLLFILCLESKALFKFFLEKNVIALIREERLGGIFEKMSQVYIKNEENFDRFSSSLLNEFTDSSQTLKIYQPFLQTDDKEEKEALFKDCLLTLEKKNKKLEASQMVSDLKIKGGEDFRQLEKIFQLTKQRLTR